LASIPLVSETTRKCTASLYAPTAPHSHTDRQMSQADHYMRCDGEYTHKIKTKSCEMPTKYTI